MNSDVREETQVGTFVEKCFVVAVREFVRLIVLTIWLLVGILFWIPLLTRTIWTFTWNIVVSSFTGTNVAHAQRGLDRAIKFYAAGFKTINRAVSRGPVTDSQDRGPNSRFLWGLLPDLAFTVIFWTVFGLVYGVIMIDVPRLSTVVADFLSAAREHIVGQTK